MPFMKYLLLSSLLLTCALGAFEHDLHLTTLPGKSEAVMICLHGYGGSYKIAERIRKITGVEETLVSFNFPDHGISPDKDHTNCTFGTPKEILPVIHVLKKCIIDEKRDRVNVYAISAGSGAFVNTLAALATDQNIGLSPEEKKTILKALSRGKIILDVPLKSVDEILVFKGADPRMELIAQRYRDNDMRPIDSLCKLKDLSLDIVVYIEEPDEILSNKDDTLYLERLYTANRFGKTVVICSKSGGHGGIHPDLWEHYTKQPVK